MWECGVHCSYPSRASTVVLVGDTVRVFEGTWDEGGGVVEVSARRE